MEPLVHLYSVHSTACHTDLPVALNLTRTLFNLLIGATSPVPLANGQALQRATTRLSNSNRDKFCFDKKVLIFPLIVDTLLHYCTQLHVSCCPPEVHEYGDIWPIPQASLTFLGRIFPRIITLQKTQSVVQQQKFISTSPQCHSTFFICKSVTS